MGIDTISDIEQLRRITKALMSRVEGSMAQQGNSFSLFQTAINLEGQVKRRTDELTVTLHNLEQTNAELARAKEASEVADLSKTRFLAAASHDVLQPLHAAQLSISALAELQASPKGKVLARQVERSLDTMNDMLRTLLDISRLDAGVVHPEFTSVRLPAILEDIEADFASIAREKDLDLRIRPRDFYVRSDKTMLRRILQNLVSNALRYTMNGGVLVGARRIGDNVLIEVADTGCGIPADQYELIFDEFHRGVIPQDQYEGAHVGLGLGLSIVKRMVTALDHELRFSSREGRGTRFRLTVPLAARKAVHAKFGAADRNGRSGRALQGSNILLIENDPDVLEAMNALLAGWGCNVSWARTTQEAVQNLRISLQPPDIVVADQHLDHGDLGTTAIERIRNYLGRSVPAVVITADPTEYVEEKTKSLGVDLMLKPVKPAQLRALFTHFLSDQK